MKNRLWAAVAMVAFCLPAFGFVDTSGKYTANPAPDVAPNVNKPGSGGGSFGGSGGGSRTPDIIRPDLGGGAGPVQGIPSMPLPNGGAGSAGAGAGGGTSAAGALAGQLGANARQAAGADKGGDKGGSGAGGGLPTGSVPKEPYVTDQAYLAALREWGKRWANYFKSLTESEQAVQTNLTKKLADCVMLYGASKVGKECSDAAIKEAELERQRIEKLRSDGIARAAKEKAAIDAMKPRPVPAVPVPDVGAGVGGGAGNTSTNTTTTTTTTSNNTTTNITHNTTTNNNTTIENKFEDKNDMEAFCKTHPQALSCITTKDAKFDDKNEDVKEEKPSKDFSKFKVTNYFSGGGACPADVSVNVGIFGSFALSYGWLCRLAAIMRPLVIAFAWLSALFIIVKGSRSE
jgi:epstein-barr nuclear antigen 1